jgi:hypothetical protein
VVASQANAAGRGALTASAIGAAVLGSVDVVAVNRGVVGRALSETSTASLGAGVAFTADGLLGLVPESVATAEAQARERHDSELVRVRAGSSAGRGGQDGDGNSSTEEHIDNVFVS